MCHLPLEIGESNSGWGKWLPFSLLVRSGTMHNKNATVQTERVTKFTHKKSQLEVARTRKAQEFQRYHYSRACTA